MWVGWRRSVGKGSWLGNATELEVMKASTAFVACCCRENKEGTSIGKLLAVKRPLQGSSREEEHSKGARGRR